MDVYGPALERVKTEKWGRNGKFIASAADGFSRDVLIVAYNATIGRVQSDDE